MPFGLGEGAGPTSRQLIELHAAVSREECGSVRVLPIEQLLRILPQPEPPVARAFSGVPREARSENVRAKKAAAVSGGAGLTCTSVRA
jgi:hypothetical protein